MHLNNKRFMQFIEKQLHEDEDTQIADPPFDPPVGPSLHDNEMALKTIFYSSEDLCIRYFTLKSNGASAFAANLEELTDNQLLAQSVLEPLISQSANPQTVADPSADLMQTVGHQLISFGKVCEESKMDPIANGLLNGNTAIFIAGQTSALLVNVQKKNVRDIGEPAIESTVWGARQSFVENTRINISLVRAIIKSPKLVVETFPLDSKVKSEIYIVFFAGRASSSVLEQVRHRLSKIKTLVPDSGYIQQYLSEQHASPFATADYTERPDKVAARLMEGKVAVFCEGSPFAVMVPLTFQNSFQTVEDYYLPPFFASFTRILRHLAFWISMLAAPLYVALATFHQEMIPTILLIRASASREGIPFPSSLEALIMLIVFDLLREAGIRAPKPVGQTISFIGALILGQSAVQAGIVSAPMVIIVALTGVTTLINYHQKNANILLRLLLLFAGSVMGIFGIQVGMVLILIRLCAIESFGIPYLSPLAPLHVKELKDVFFRLPFPFMEFISNRKR